MEEQTQETKKMNPMVIGAIAVVLIALVGYGLTRSKAATSQPQEAMNVTQESPSTATSTVESSPTVAGAEDSAVSDSEVKIVDVEAGSFYYKPNEIRVKKGEKVKIVMKSVDMMHDFNIDELGVKMPIVKSGNTGTVEFTADQTGTFEYYCSVGQHRQNGQIGKLIVE